MAEPIKFDVVVVVVGAGLAGLAGCVIASRLRGG
jgi:branched-subunit amino acid ABC-type transport system permease component